MKIQRITDSSFPGFIRLWQQTFGDSEESVRFFLDHFEEELHAFTLEEEGKLCSILTLFRMGSLHIPALKRPYLPVWVSYAISTAPEARERGYGSALTDFARREILNGGGLSMLSPAGQELIHFYEPLGYRPSFTVEEGTAPAAGTEEDLPFIRIRPEEYGEIREELLKNTVHVRLSRKTLALEEKYSAGGGFFRTAEGDLIFTLETGHDGKKYLPEVVRNTEASSEKLHSAASVLASCLHQKEILYRTPALTGSGTAKVQAMISSPEIREKEGLLLPDPDCPEKVSGTDFAPYFGFPFD